jgi:hypothetical protein
MDSVPVFSRPRESQRQCFQGIAFLATVQPSSSRVAKTSSQPMPALHMSSHDAERW